MQPYQLISGLVLVAFTCGVCPVSSSVNSNNVNLNQDINRKQALIYSQNGQHPYQHYSPNHGNQYANVKVVDQRVSSNDYNTEYDDQDEIGSFTSDASDRQDFLGAETLSTLAIALGAFAAGAAAFALIQNSNQPDNDSFNALKTRVTSLESDQTNICTTVKAFAGADTDGVTVDTGFTDTSVGEQGYLQNLAAVSSPTCS